ncbi:FliA/WhiG family RNA polymerase sigma factor [Nocardioides bruguierae]|uniref:FliA/WhiG family RNA polymerase sigma factor n=1 Tax=Nocardioides bruguierae TaxID=2945102 RepID=A0A9X2IGH3_9ACTN|nr:FliA/WhiG family RNA polymerase sigma factor [Nocardioides bruguierae]MCM0622372.1 FliA/WhiG family RNA polymerase sigma factor [Nocardioides bruguierae]
MTELLDRVTPPEGPRPHSEAAATPQPRSPEESTTESRRPGAHRRPEPLPTSSDAQGPGLADPTPDAAGVPGPRHVRPVPDDEPFAHVSADEGEDGDGALWRAIRERGDLAARNELMLRYAGLVKYVAGRVRSGMPASVETGDLVSEGMIGLIDAIERFEPDRGLRFPTFAVPRIRGAILDAVRADDWAPRSVRRRARELERTAHALRTDLGRQPTDDELASASGLETEEVRTALQPRTWVRYASVTELDELHEVGRDWTDALEDEEVRERLLPAVQALPERDRVILALSFFEGLTLAEIGRVLGVTESRVSQLRTRATRELRQVLLQQTAG